MASIIQHRDVCLHYLTGFHFHSACVYYFELCKCKPMQYMPQQNKLLIKSNINDIFSLSLVFSLQAEKCILCLCQVLSLSSVHELYRQHMAQLLQWLLESQTSWSTYSIQKTQLEIIALQSGVYGHVFITWWGSRSI